MKKRIIKITALLFSAALLALPGTALSARQTNCAASVRSASPNVIYACPIPADAQEDGIH